MELTEIFAGLITNLEMRFSLLKHGRFSNDNSVFNTLLPFNTLSILIPYMSFQVNYF